MTTMFPELAKKPQPYAYEHLMHHPGDPITRNLVPFRAYSLEIRRFLSMQVSHHTLNEIARLMEIVGPPGSGKTEGLIAALLAEGYSLLSASADEFASDVENGATEVLHTMLSDAERMSMETKRRFALAIHDMHLATITAVENDANIGKTVNAALLLSTLMNLADNRQLYRNYDGSNIAFFITLNSLRDIPATLKRPGRAVIYTHAPGPTDKMDVAWAVLDPRSVEEGDLVKAVARKYRHQPVAFWKALKLKIQSKAAEPAYRYHVADTATLDSYYGRRVPLTPELVWACAKETRRNLAEDWLKKRGFLNRLIRR